MELIIITGMSGSGKTTALNVMEDMGYYAMDNLPPQLMRNFIELTNNSNAAIEKVAVVTDIRGGILFNSLISQIEYLETLNLDVKVVFLDANDDTLVRRYKELRRPHPLSKNGSIEKGIEEERKILEPIKDRADIYLDTSNLNIWKFKRKLSGFFNGDKSSSIVVNITSFGYKYGILKEADIIMDMRFLPNPFYISELKDKNGLDDEIKEYVHSFEISKKFLNDFSSLILNLLPHYTKQGKLDLTIGIGCTGGKHRSVVMAEDLGKVLSEKEVKVNINHRDDKYWKLT